MQIKNKKFLIYGAGASGISAYDFVERMGGTAKIFVDKKVPLPQNYHQIKKLENENLKQFDYAILSPGVEILGNKILSELRLSGIKILSELELGYLFCRGKFVAITGTNGKTTTVSLLGHLLSADYKTFVCGNIGLPITRICDQTTEDSVVVCEVSSFMLEEISANFSPFISAILNITPDHIARHKTFEEYKRIKQNITAYQLSNQYFLTTKEYKGTPTKAHKIVLENFKKFKSKLIGEFNDVNINFCYEICKILGLCDKKFKRQLKTFQPVEFRLQKVAKIKGVTYINDSKSTNPDSCIKALQAMKKPVILLLGGSDKGNDFNDIFKLKNKIKSALIYGDTAGKIEADAVKEGFFKTSKFQNLKEAMLALKYFLHRGDVVLFSPACASFDEFENYIKRGEFFNNCIKNN